jgi:hypothetical protein
MGPTHLLLILLSGLLLGAVARKLVFPRAFFRAVKRSPYLSLLLKWLKLFEEVKLRSESVWTIQKVVERFVENSGLTARCGFWLDWF